MVVSNNKNLFILSVGDEGAILTHVVGGRIESRHFAKTPSECDFAKTLQQHANVDITILLDVLDQSYIQHTLPPVNSINAQKLIQRKLEKDYSKSDLKSSILLGRDKSGKKEWHYLLASTRFTAPLTDWLDYLDMVPNRLRSICLLPIEWSSILHDILKARQKNGHTVRDDSWHIVVSHQRVGGFRQMVFKKNKVIFTRITQPVGGSDPEIIAGNIEQETLNTIEYIRRLGYKDEYPLNLFYITSEKVKNKLSSRTFPNIGFEKYTPHELVEQIGMPDADTPSDRFGDVLAAVHFAT